MALAKERGAYPIFRIHPIVYEFYYLYYIFIFRYSLIIKTNEKVPDARNDDDRILLVRAEDLLTQMLPYRLAYSLHLTRGCREGSRC